MIVTRRMISFKNENGYTKFVTDGAEIHVFFMKDRVIRIRAGFCSDFEEASYTLVETAWDDCMDEYMQDERHRIISQIPEVFEKEDCVVLQGKELRVCVEKEPFEIRVYDTDGTCLHADIPDLCYRCDSNNRRMHTCEISDDDSFYGFGEKTGEIDKAGTYMTMSPSDAMGYDAKETDSLYKHIPFYIKLNAISRKAVGYFYHNTAECDFDMGRSRSNYWKRHSTYRTDSGDIDLFLIAGPTIREVIERYTDLTGKGAMLPRYALGYLGSSMYYAELPEDCDKAILNFAETAEKEEIPMDGFQLSSGYCAQENNKRCTFTWNPMRFKDPSLWFEEMEKKGISVSPNVKPGMLTVHPLIEEMKEKGMFIRSSDSDDPGIGTWWGGKGMFVDFTKPDARKEWKSYLTGNVLDYGTASVWNDNCEYESLVDKDCRCDFEGKGETIGHVKAIMSNLMCKEACTAIHERYPDIRPFVVCRSGHAGIQRYAQTWAGDNRTSWETLKYNIATILGMGMSGVANQGCDVGGFYGPAPEPELFVRWVQNGIFMPRFSIHSVNVDNTVTEPWMYPEYTGYIRDAIRFRYQLSPYFYSLMQEAHTSGLPIMRSMAEEFQQDVHVYKEGVDFMLGEALLVANVVEKGAENRKIYLPEGEVFYDLISRKKYTGGQMIEYPVTLETIPMFVRGGSILPLAENKISNLHKDTVTDIRYVIAPDRDTSFTLYEDDGISMKYRDGEYRKTSIRVTAGAIVTVSFAGEGNYKSTIKTVLLDVICPEKAPYWVTVCEKKQKQYLYRPDFEQAECGWYYDPLRKSVLVRYPCPFGDYEVKVSFEQFDMIGM